MELDCEGCEGVETVAVRSAGEGRNRGADCDRLGEDNRLCGSLCERCCAENSKAPYADRADESPKGAHVHPSQHFVYLHAFWIISVQKAWRKTKCLLDHFGPASAVEPDPRNSCY